MIRKMDKNELISNIHWTKEVVLETEDLLYEQYNQERDHRLLLAGPLEVLMNPFHVRAYVVLILFLILSYSALSNVIGGLFSVLVGIVAHITLVRVMNKTLIARPSHQEKILECEESIEACDERIDELIDSLHEKSEVPEAYWDSDAIEKIEEYLVNRRADTLKECLNLYEQEESHDQLRSVMEQHHQEHVNTIKHLEKSNQESIKSLEREMKRNRYVD
jgi:hypothetical protein